jgi:hypothetical protein
MYDLNRKIRPLGKEYISLINKWKNVITAESFGVPLI